MKLASLFNLKLLYENYCEMIFPNIISTTKFIPALKY